MTKEKIADLANGLSEIRESILRNLFNLKNGFLEEYLEVQINLYLLGWFKGQFIIIENGNMDLRYPTAFTTDILLEFLNSGTIKLEPVPSLILNYLEDVNSNLESPKLRTS